MYRRVAILIVGGMLCLAAMPTPGQEGIVTQLYGNGVHAYFAGQYEEAYEFFSSAIRAGTKDPRVYYFRGLTYWKLGRQEEATQDFAKGAELETADVNQLYPVGRALQRVQGNPRVLLEQYREEARLASWNRQRAVERARYEGLRQREQEILKEQAQAPPQAPKMPPIETPPAPSEKPAAPPFVEQPAEKLPAAPETKSEEKPVMLPETPEEKPETKPEEEPAEKPAAKPTLPSPFEETPAEKPAMKPEEKPAEKPGEETPAEKPKEKPAEKPAENPFEEKPAEKKPAAKPTLPSPFEETPAEKPAMKPEEKPAEKPGEETPAEKPKEKPAEKPGENPFEEKPAEKPAAKPTLPSPFEETPAEKPAEKPGEETPAMKPEKKPAETSPEKPAEKPAGQAQSGGLLKGLWGAVRKTAEDMTKPAGQTLEKVLPSGGAGVSPFPGAPMPGEPKLDKPVPPPFPGLPGAEPGMEKPKAGANPFETEPAAKPTEKPSESAPEKPAEKVPLPKLPNPFE